MQRSFTSGKSLLDVTTPTSALHRENSMKWLTLLIATLLLAVAGLGQGSRGTIVGNVIDASGGSVVVATVTATNTDTGAQAKATTNPSGFYQFVELPPGMYSVTVEASGFAKTTIARSVLWLQAISAWTYHYKSARSVKA